MISSVNAAPGQVASFMITNTKLYVLVVTLSTKDNTNLTKQLNEGFKRTIYWNQYVPKPFPETPKNLLLMQLFKVLTDYLFLLLKILVQMKLLMLLRHEIYLLTE